MSLNLSPGEQVVFEGHPSWRAILAFYLKGIAITAAIVVVLVLADRIGDFIGTGVIILVLLAGAAITILAGFIKRVSTRYTITNRRLHIKHGILSRDVQQTRLEKVQDVNYSQSAVQRLLQVGDIDFDTATNDPTTFIFAGVNDPEEVVEAVDRANRLRGDSGLGDEPAPAS
ncbi:MAG TPA: PH domain-containing protein [Solirubrobacterales bacterium]|nr:PH domain-containing protein [Solirubrobacterales bacterium]